MARRRNPGFLEWAKLHPWMTFFLVGAAIQIPIAIFQTAAVLKAATPPAPPVDPLSKPTPPPTPGPVPPALGGGTVFVPGVIDPATGKV